jgi:hypothetical protein
MMVLPSSTRVEMKRLLRLLLLLLLWQLSIIQLVGVQWHSNTCPTLGLPSPQDQPLHSMMKHSAAEEEVVL